MTIRNLGTTLRDSLLNNEEFNYAHLVKFEKPTRSESQGNTSRKANTYSYISDSAFDIYWDDESKDAQAGANGPQTYYANKLIKVGSTSETVEAKASNLNIILDSSALGASVTTTQIAWNSGIDNELTVPPSVDLIDAGFREGDKVYFTESTNAAGSKHANHKAYVIIKKFKNASTFTYTPVGTVATGVTTTLTWTLSLASEELTSLVNNKDSATTYTSYLNREVFIYKAHLRVDPVTILGVVHPAGSIIGAPFLLFKGIITSGSITEDPAKKSAISWALSSHWGDFSRVSGRLTMDDAHRALDGAGNADLDAVVRPEYAGDLGFVHANQSLNVMALYKDIEIEYKQVDINGGWFGGKRIREVEVEVERRTDLAFNLSPKYLPVVYGVQKIDAIPVFVDTSNNDAADIYVAYALCEGPIAGLLDIYLEGNSNICVDKADEDLRSAGGEAVDLKCFGRMDRGDTLKGYDSNTGSFNSDTNALLDNWSVYAGTDGGRRYASSLRMGRFRLQNYNSTDTGSDTTLDTSTGLLHEQTHTITSPINGNIQFHQGQADQKANATLVNKASSASGFKIQNDYFTGKKGEYWGSSHQLLDTAYTVANFTIAAGETTIPEMDFIVRGKMLDCHNYDRSYVNTNVVVAGVTHASFLIGQTVSLRVGGGNFVNSNDSDASAVTIIDKWSFLDDKGVKQYRFITDYNKDIKSSHYMQLNSDGNIKWYMAPTVSTDDLSSTVTSSVSTTIASSSATSGGGIDVVVNPAAVFTAAIAASIAAEMNGALTFSGTSRRDLENGLHTDVTYNSASNTLSGIGSGTTVTALDSAVTTVFVKDAIALNNAHANGADGYYIGQSITLTRFDADGVPYIQQKTITAYSTTGNVAVVDSTWDAGYLPTAGDAYVISAGKPDKRVSINPAIQILDYLTSKRYGRGLDIDLDIDLESFKSAARDCDTRSTITVLCPSSVSPSPGQKYEYAPSGILHFRGTVLGTPVSRLIGSTTYKEVVFKDVIGKLGHKFNTWEAVSANSVIWHEGSLHLLTADSASGYSLNAGNTITSLSLTQIGGGTALVLDVAQISANGNPLVKKWIADSPTSTKGSAIGSGYSLYDSDDIKYWKYIGWDSNQQRNVTRHQMNQTVSTSNPIFDNINLMLKQFNGILRYSNGKYQLAIKGRAPASYVSGETINEGDIIGAISLKDGGAKKTYNSVSTSIKDPHNKFESRSVSFFNSNYLKQDKSIPKKGSYGLPGITNYFNARFNINQMLDESRYGLTVSFKMMPKGYLLLPGNIIQLNYPRFGWSNKLFRINTLAATSDCLVNITATEHNNAAYVIGNLGKPGLGSDIETGGIQGRNIPTGPSNLAVSTSTVGAINLTWDNAADYNPSNYTTSIHYATANDREHSSFKLLVTTDADEYSHVVTDQSLQTFYYWVRHRTVKSNGDLLHSEYHPANATAGVLGSATGSTDGNSPLGGNLIANQYVIPYSAANTESTTIVFTASAVNFVTDADRRYRFYINGSGTPASDVTNTSNSQSFTLPQANEPATGTQTTVKVDITQSGTTISDSTSIYGIKDGVDAFTVVLTNEAHVIPGDSVGAALTYANSGTDIRVFHGSTALTFGTGASTYSVSAVAANITVNASPTTENFGGVTNSTRRFGSASAMADADTSASITYTITARDSANVATTFTKVQSFTKGTAGANAKVVGLTASQYVIPYTAAGSESTTLTFTADSKNTAGTKVYKFFVDGSIKQTTSQTADTKTYVLADADEPASGAQKTIRVDVEQPSGTVVASDSVSVYGIKNGIDGSGVSAFTVILTNEAHAIAALSTGVAKGYANSGTDIRVFFGTTPLTYNTSGANTFNVTATSGNNIDPNTSPTTVSTYTRRYGVASGMLDSAFADFITYTIVARDNNGNATTFTKIQSFIKGNDGATPDALTITSNTDNGATRTIVFSDGTSVTINNGTAGVTKGVVPLYATSTNPTTWSAVSLAQGSNTHVNFYEYTGTFSNLSDSAVEALTFVKVIGEPGDSEGVVPVYSSNATGSNKSFSITDAAFTDREYVNFYEWSGSKPQIGDSVVTNLNTFVKFVGSSTKTVQIFSLNDSTVGFSGGGSAASQTFANPVLNLESGWSTTQPALVANLDKVYMSQRTFTLDGLTATGNETSWSATAVVAQREDGAASTVAGPNGLRTIQGYLYYERSTGTLSDAPAKPSNNLFYTFSNGLVSGTGVGTAVNTWTNQPRVNNATSTNTHWAVRYFGNETAASTTTITIPTGQLSNVVQSTVFSGVVTFNGGTLQDQAGNSVDAIEASDVAAHIGGANTTTIDGGVIDTNTINVNRLTVGEQDRTASRVLLLEDSLKIFDGSSLRVHLGNLSNLNT